MTTARTLIKDAVIDLGAHDPGESLSGGDASHGLRVLNRMIKAWSGENLMIPFTTTDSFSVSSGTASYTYGTSGTASSTFARAVLGGYIRDTGGIDRPLTVIDQHRYNSIRDKDLGGIPDRIFYDPTYPTGTLYFYKSPTAGYTAYIESIQDLHSELSLATTVSLDGVYEDAIVLNLRNRLARSFGVAVDVLMMKEADDAKRVIKTLNLNNRMEEMDIPAGMGGRVQTYSIEEG